MKFAAVSPTFESLTCKTKALMARRLIRRQVAHTLPDIPPLLNRLFVGRGIVSGEDLDHSLSNLLSPDTFKGMDDAVSVLQETITNQQQILIIGDFDADGATSSALMVSGLRAMGARHVDYLVPDRFKYGYGLTPEIVTAALEFSPDLIVTVDNGISSIEGVDAANEHGIKVVITDHHLSGEVLPSAHAIVNPNQKGCEFPSKAIAGVGVAFYLLSALRTSLRKTDWFEQRLEPNLADYLDLVALGTISDVVPMDKNNRILVAQGIRRIRAGRARPGIYALISVAGAEFQQITTRDLAFGVGPRLNAAGRLENMSLGIECFLSQGERAVELANELDTINKERKNIEAGMKVQAEQHIQQALKNDESDKVGICLFHPDWHQGVVGIVASRMKEKFHRPVIAFARAGDNELKGSGRSIAGLHIRDALDSIATKNPGLLVKFGGHAMAAGLSIEPHNYDEFSRLFDEEASRWLTDEYLEQVLVSDGEIEEELSLSLVKSIVEAAPWGQAFPEPLFDGEFEVMDQRIVAEKHLKLKLRPVNEANTVEAIAFFHDRLLERRNLRLAYRVDINRYRGRESVQLIIESTDLSMS
jgi:single-stranded-DNA-specific exonuclease